MFSCFHFLFFLTSFEPATVPLKLQSFSFTVVLFYGAAQSFTAVKQESRMSVFDTTLNLNFRL